MVNLRQPTDNSNTKNIYRNKGTKEHVINESNAVAVMRITDLKA